MARYAGARTLAFGGDEKAASERDSYQPRSPSQAEGMMAWEGKECKESSVMNSPRQIELEKARC